MPPRTQYLFLPTTRLCRRHRLARRMDAACPAFEQRRQLCGRQMDHAVFGQRKMPSSSRLTNRHRPVPSQYTSLIRTARLRGTRRPRWRTDPPPCSRAPAPPIHRRPCGSPHVCSRPRRGPRRWSRSRAGFQSPQHRGDRVRRDTNANAHRYAIDGGLTRSSRRFFQLPARRLALPMARRVGRCRIDHRRDSRSPSLQTTAWASLTCRRQPNDCCGDNPCRRATPGTELPLVPIFATTHGPCPRRSTSAGDPHR
ncbi:MAG: hypothetical protein JWL86_2105 [Rhizobium sp.]|nr:hypothetical protein [Rhizobium sp.]